jgi:hypothetical protein
MQGMNMEQRKSSWLSEGASVQCEVKGVVCCVLLVQYFFSKPFFLCWFIDGQKIHFFKPMC